MAIGAIGNHRLEYEVVEGWERLPEGWAFTDVVGVAVDSRERVFVFCRGSQPLIIFDKEGRFVDAWGAGRFVRPHGIFISADDRVFLTDDEGHTVHEFTLDGTPRRRLGDGRPSDTGYVAWQSPVTRAAGPFNTVTNVALAPDGEIYAADGYGNAQVHRFAADGRLVARGASPVAGRDSSTCRTVSPWTRVAGCTSRTGGTAGSRSSPATAPCWTSGTGSTGPATSSSMPRSGSASRNWASSSATNRSPTSVSCRPSRPGHSPIAQVSICTPDGTLIGRVGGEQSILPGNFFAPHGLCVSPRGDLYVGEVVAATGVVRRLAPLTPHCLQKFVRRSG